MKYIAFVYGTAFLLAVCYGLGKLITQVSRIEDRLVQILKRMEETK
jgi:hypothetical protein